MPKLRNDPNWEPKPPAAADMFCHLDDPGDPDSRMAAIQEAADKFRERGAMQMRVTLVNSEYPDSGYPFGLWIEGWRNKSVPQLPFGSSEVEGGPVFPPLTAMGTNPEGEG